MRNFETPKINISLFAAENVATTASNDNIQGLNAVEARTTFIGDNTDKASRIFEFTFTE